jgi:hypothetical protein
MAFHKINQSAGGIASELRNSIVGIAAGIATLRKVRGQIENMSDTQKTELAGIANADIQSVLDITQGVLNIADGTQNVDGSEDNRLNELLTKLG